MSICGRYALYTLPDNVHAARGGRCLRWRNEAEDFMVFHYHSNHPLGVRQDHIPVIVKFGVHAETLSDVRLYFLRLK